MIKSKSDAYRVIAGVLTTNTDSEWSTLIARCTILGIGCGGIETVRLDSKGECDIPIGFGVFKIEEACIFLRNELLRRTGRRAWHLIYRLHQNDAFEVEFDYDKPAHYDETEEPTELAAAGLPSKMSNPQIDK